MAMRSNAIKRHACNLMDQFLYYRDPSHERAKLYEQKEDKNCHIAMAPRASLNPLKILKNCNQRN